ncbi:MAG: helix-turn-helix transcriptional regulator [Dehalococcoidia bacterium]
MRAARLITLLLLLQSRGRMSGRELADALEVSVRTVYRDIEALNGGGVPIYADRGAGGGFRLLEGYRVQLETLTAAEASALPFVGLPDVAGALGLAEASASAALKLERALPAPHRELVDEAASLVHVDLRSARDAADDTLLRATVSAARARRVLEIVTTDGVTEFAPLGVVYRDGWYAVGLVRGKPTSLPLAWLRGVRGTSRRFERPAFDLGAWWRGAPRDTARSSN